MFKSKLALVLGIFPIAALVHALMVWSSLGTDAAWPWIVNDLSYHLYVPFLLPAGLAALIPTRPWLTLSKVEGRTAWIGLLIVFVLLSALGGLNDALTRDDEPYFYKDVTLVLSEQQRIRQELKDAWNNGDAALDEKRAKGRTAYDEAKARSQRGSAADVMHGAITVMSSAAIGAAFWVFGLTFFVGVRLRRQGKRLAKTAADAMTLAMGLLILWFPARLYTEWHLHFYSFDQLHNFGMFFVVAFIALFALILLILLRFAWDLVGAVSGVSASLSAATGLIALMKPEALWYAWWVIESLPGVAWAIILTATAFMSILIARLAHSE